MTKRQKAIIAATEKLDLENDNQWNEDGSARLEAIQLLMTDDTVTSAEVAEVAPDIRRTWEPGNDQEAGNHSAPAEQREQDSLREGPDEALGGRVSKRLEIGPVNMTVDLASATSPATPPTTTRPVLKSSDKRVDRIVVALEAMDHSDPKQWCEDGSPNAQVLSKRAGLSISHQEIRSIAPGFRRQAPSPDEIKRARGVTTDQDGVSYDDAGRPVIDLTNVSPEQVAEMRVALDEVKGLIGEQEAIRDAAIRRLWQLTMEADALDAALRPFRSQKFADVIKQYQARQHEATERRVRDNKQVTDALGIRHEPHATELDAYLRHRRRPAHTIQGATIKQEQPVG